MGIEKPPPRRKTKKFKEAFGKWIKKSIAEVDMSIKDLAIAVGVSRTTAYNWSMGRKSFISDSNYELVELVIERRAERRGIQYNHEEGNEKESNEVFVDEGHVSINGSRFEVAMKNSSFSIRSFCRAAGIGERTLYRWKSSQPIPIYALYGLAHILKVNPQWLTGQDNNINLIREKTEDLNTRGADRLKDVMKKSLASFKTRMAFAMEDIKSLEKTMEF